MGLDLRVGAGELRKLIHRLRLYRILPCLGVDAIKIDEIIRASLSHGASATGGRIENGHKNPPTFAI